MRVAVSDVPHSIRTLRLLSPQQEVPALCLDWWWTLKCKYTPWSWGTFSGSPLWKMSWLWAGPQSSTKPTLDSQSPPPSCLLRYTHRWEEGRRYWKHSGSVWFVSQTIRQNSWIYLHEIIFNLIYFFMYTFNTEFFFFPAVHTWKLLLALFRSENRSAMEDTKHFPSVRANIVLAHGRGLWC